LLYSLIYVILGEAARTEQGDRTVSASLGSPRTSARTYFVLRQYSTTPVQNSQVPNPPFFLDAEIVLARCRVTKENAATDELTRQVLEP
jgi:hypothetical protein